MTIAGLRLETVTRVAPLGLRFWDDVTGAIVRDDLYVVAYPQDQPELTTAAIVTRSGVFAFVDLPGLRDQSPGAGDAAYWAAVKRRSFIVQVIDHQSRFQSFQVAVQAPAQIRQMGQAQVPYTLECGSPPGAPPDTQQAGIPLFSSPARAVPGAMAVLRAQLWDVARNAPAAYALIEAREAGEAGESGNNGRTIARGFADQNGAVVLIFAYPEPERSPIASPLSPVGGRRRLVDQSWTIQLSAFYTPGTPVPPIPDLCQVLNQAAATLYLTLSPPLPLAETTLVFGHESILKSQSEPVLLIAPN